DALDHVERLDGGGGPGVWLPRDYARGGGLQVGDQIRVGGTEVAVAGLYTDLWATTPDPSWCDYRVLYANDVSANTPPPGMLLATDLATFTRLAAGFRSVCALAQVPVAADGQSDTTARELLADQDAA